MGNMNGPVTGLILGLRGRREDKYYLDQENAVHHKYQKHTRTSDDKRG